MCDSFSNLILFPELQPITIAKEVRTKRREVGCIEGRAFPGLEGGLGQEQGRTTWECALFLRQIKCNHLNNTNLRHHKLKTRLFFQGERKLSVLLSQPLGPDDSHDLARVLTLCDTLLLPKELIDWGTTTWVAVACYSVSSFLSLQPSLPSACHLREALLPTRLIKSLLDHRPRFTHHHKDHHVSILRRRDSDHHNNRSFGFFSTHTIEQLFSVSPSTDRSAGPLLHRQQNRSTGSLTRTTTSCKSRTSC